GDLGTAEAFLDHTQYFGYLLPSLCVLMAMRVSWFDWRVVAGLLLSAIMLAFLSQSGGRRIIGVAIGAALFTHMAARPQLRLKIMLGASAIVILLLLFMQEMLRYRAVGFANWWTGETPEMTVTYLAVDDNFLRLA